MVAISDKAKKLFKEHWDWHRRFLKDVSGISDLELDRLGRVAEDYFIHGYKHGARNKKK